MKLRLFLDTTDVEEVENALQKEILSGIVTKSGSIANDYIANIKKMVELCKRYNQKIPISIEVLENDFKKVISQAKNFISQINYSNLNIRIPISWDGLGAIKEFSKNNINVDYAGGMNEAQAILAANAGARYFSISLSRIKDMGSDPYKVIGNSCKLLKGFDIEIIVSGIRSKNMKDVIDAFLAGAHIVSVPFDVLEKMAVHPKTTENIIRFVNAFHQWGKQ